MRSQKIDADRENRRLREALEAAKQRIEKERRAREEVEARKEALEEELDRTKKEYDRTKTEFDRTKKEYERLRKYVARITGTPAFLALSDKTAEAAGVPSSKVYYRRAAERNPDGSKRRPGGQPGHKGRARKRPRPNLPPLEVTLERCPMTGAQLPSPADWLERTITDLPAPTVDIYQERRARYHCPCGERHMAESPFPPYRQWGPHLVAFVVHHRMLALSLEKIQALLEEWHGLHVSQGAILGMEAHAAELLGPRYEQIRQQVLAAPVVGADETGFRVGGKNGWMWTFVTMNAVLYEVADTRGASVPRRVLEGFGGTLLTDAWKGYDPLAWLVRALDALHINRWLERAEHKARVEPRSLLSRAPAKLTKAGRPPAELLRFVEGVRGLLQEAIDFAEGEPPPSAEERERAYKSFRRRLMRLVDRPWKHPDAVRIAKELRKRVDMVFTFVRDPEVPYHNNGAENAIRQGVLHRKVSGGRRSWTGAEILAVLLSVFQSCRKGGERFTELIRDLYMGGAGRGSATPSRVPQT